MKSNQTLATNLCVLLLVSVLITVLFIPEKTLSLKRMAQVHQKSKNKPVDKNMSMVNQTNAINRTVLAHLK